MNKNSIFIYIKQLV